MYYYGCVGCIYNTVSNIGCAIRSGGLQSFFGALNYHSQIVMFYIKCSLNFTINHHHTSIAWIDPNKYWPEPTSKRSPSGQDSTSTKSRACKKLKFKRKKNVSLIDKNLDLYNRYLRWRLNKKLNHLPEAPDTKEGSCAFHYFNNKFKHCKHFYEVPSMSSYFMPRMLQDFPFYTWLVMAT